MGSWLPGHWCVVCRQGGSLIVGSNIRYGEYEGHYCESCAEDVWDCPDCDRSFYIGNMAVNKDGDRTKPRHLRMTGRIDGRLREIREVCPGWKTPQRKKTDDWMQQDFLISQDVKSYRGQPRKC